MDLSKAAFGYMDPHPLLLCLPGNSYFPIRITMQVGPHLLISDLFFNIRFPSVKGTRQFVPHSLDLISMNANIVHYEDVP
uniref:Uncharacterized protein n=1 Tax=Lepeophtheirus salmonis TaxID=72036 RepID=A0A0K2TJQ7_LEPSM